MNVNEVIAHRAAEIAGESIHANTHVNMSQSTNDVVPSAMKLATHRLLVDVADALEPLIASTDAVVTATADIVKVARTCLQDAVPITLGQGFGAHRTALTRMRAELIVIAGEALTIPIGATAVGTGLGAVSGYRRQVVKELRSATGLDIRSDDDLRRPDQHRHTCPGQRSAQDAGADGLQTSKGHSFDVERAAGRAFRDFDCTDPERIVDHAWQSQPSSA